MIGWENNQGAYFIDKLQQRIEKLQEDITSDEAKVGNLADLTTSSKTSVVSAINSVKSDVNTLSGNMPTVTKTTIDITSQLGSASSNFIKKFGNVVVVSLFFSFIQGATASGEVTLGTVPEGYRPNENTYVPVSTIGSTTGIYAVVTPTGNVVVPSSVVTSKGGVFINAVYIIEET